MELVLEVVSPERNLMGENASHHFFPSGGVIGRSAECDWVIPDQTRHLSGRHAIVSYEAGQFYITDISTNGIYLNGPKPLTRNVAMPLHDEDRLLMGEIQLRVRVLMEYSQPRPPQPHSPQLVLDGDGSEPGLGVASRPRITPHLQPVAAKPQIPVHQVPVAQIPVAQMPVPGARAGSGSKPSLRPVAGPEPEPAPAPVQPTVISPAVTEQPSAMDAALVAFAAGAGLPVDAIRQAGADEVLHRAGALLRQCMQGLVENAHARASLKNELHLDMTLVNSHDNNPVKLAANADQVLKHLLVEDPGSFLSLEAGVQECFADFQQHQSAMMAGMQGALQELLLELSPAELERRFEQQRRGPTLSSKGARCWNAYRELHRDFQAEENLFDSLFADPFARAYDQQINQLKKSAR